MLHEILKWIKAYFRGDDNPVQQDVPFFCLFLTLKLWKFVERGKNIESDFSAYSNLIGVFRLLVS